MPRWLKNEEVRYKIVLGWLGLTILLLPAYLIRFKLVVPTTLLEVNIYLLALIAAGLFWKDSAELIMRLKNRLSAGLLMGIGFVIVGAVIGAVVSPEKLVALGLFKAYFFDPLFVFGLILLFVRDKKDCYWLVWILGVVVIAAGVWAIFQYFGWAEALAPWKYEMPRRLNSFFEYPNAVSLFCAPVVALFFGVLLFEEKLTKKERIFGIAVVVFGLLAIILAVSRGALVAIMVGGFLMTLFSKKRWWGLTGMGIIAGVIWSNDGIRERLLHGLDGGDFSVTSRADFWQASWEVLKTKWFGGVGLGGFPQAMKDLAAASPKYQSWMADYIYPHNILHNFWLEIGLLGLLGFLFLLFWSASVIWKARKVTTSRGLAMGLATALIVWLIYGVVEVPYFKNDLAVEFWILVGLVVVCKELNARGKEDIIK